MPSRRAENKRRLTEIEKELAEIYATARKAVYVYFCRAVGAALLLIAVYYFYFSRDMGDILHLFCAITSALFILQIVYNWEKMPFFMLTPAESIYGAVFEKVMRLDAEKAELVYILYKKRIHPAYTFGCLFKILSCLILAVSCAVIGKIILF